MKPSATVTRSSAQFQSSTIIYNQSGVTYNSITTSYGGSDRKQGPAPQNVISFIHKPQNQKVE